MNVGGIHSGPQTGAPGLNRPAAAKSPTAEPVSFASANGKANGVVRLLQEGHFKGVADVRLRVNFHEQLTKTNAAATQSNYAEAITEFGAKVEVAFTNFLEGFVPTEDQAAAAIDLFNTFKSTVSEIANAFLGSGGSDFDTFATELEAEFEAFIIDLQAALEITTPDVEVPEAADLPDIALTEADAPADDSFLDEFRAAFAEELQALVQALQDGTQDLPELSGPNGNGKAYAKFLEILEGLQAPEPAPADPNTATLEGVLA